jgi:hypothetical protein
MKLEMGTGPPTAQEAGDEWDTDYDVDSLLIGGGGGGGSSGPAGLGDNDEPIRTLILLSITLTVPALLSLPPTLTHLALVDLKQQVPLNRLPSICPRLVVLDLSFIRWLAPLPDISSESGDNDDGVGQQHYQPMQKGRTLLMGVPWTRWADLQTLALVECDVTPEVVGLVNRGRWNDVEIVY